VPAVGGFAVADTRFLLTFGVMLVVALTLGGLTTRVREQAQAARLRERRTSTLYSISRDLAGARLRPDLARVMLRHLHDLVGGRVTLLLPGADGRLERVAELPAGGGSGGEKDLGVARWVFEHGSPAGLGSATLPAAGALFLPMRTPERILGVVGLQTPDSATMDSAQRQLVDSVLDQTAVALERTELAEATRRAHLEVESERLRTALLSSLSHDLRTPLAGIEGAASTLLDEERTPLSPATRRDLAATIVGEAQRMTRLIGNLLDMVRVESGALAVQREWHVLEEIVGVALLRVEDRLAGRSVATRVPSTLPLVPVDDLLIEQVLINLLENAVRHTPPGSPIEVSAEARLGEVVVSVADRGPGVPEEERERIFDKFHRAAGGSGGIGLGLAICRGIVTAHGGRIWTEPRTGGGAVFSFTIPVVGTPPPRIPPSA
jgi:two-component system sensor histidine kinase KdpD